MCLLQKSVSRLIELFWLLVYDQKVLTLESSGYLNKQT